MELEAKKQNEFSWIYIFVLTLSGGLMDAYSYLCRGNVFSNAQTGNLLLLGVNISLGNFHQVINYLLPIICFVLGISLAVVLKHFLQKLKICYEGYVLLVEALIMVGVMFINQQLNLIATSLLSFACGLQVETFRKFHQDNIATTMCIGNLRAGTEAVTEFILNKDKNSFKRAIRYFLIVLVFVIGAVIGNFLIMWISQYAIGISGLILFICSISMFLKKNCRC